MEKTILWIETIFSLAVFSLTLSALVLGVSGNPAYWQGFLYLYVFIASTLIITIYFLIKDPVLMERRIRPKETRKEQIIGQSLAAVLFFFGVIGFPALDERLGLSAVPDGVVLLADFVTIVGFSWYFGCLR